MSPPTSVSALVPTYNGERWLEESLASLAAQTHPDLTVLLSDDASTDGTWSICRRWSERQDVGAQASGVRFRAVRQDQRLGWIGNSNALLAMATTDYVFFAPQDDLFDSDYVARLAAALDGRPDAVVAYADRVDFDERGTVAVRSNPVLGRDDGPTRRGLRFVPTLYKDRDLPFRGLVRREALDRAGGLTRSRLGEFEADARWLFRLALVGPFVHVDGPLAHKRWHPESLNASWTYTRGTWRRAAMAYGPEIQRAGLRGVPKALLLLWVALQVLLWLLPKDQRHAIRWRLMRLDLRSPPPGSVASGTDRRR